MDSSARPAHVLGSSYRPQKVSLPTPESDTRVPQFIQCSHPQLELPVQGVENPNSIHQACSEGQETIRYVARSFSFDKSLIVVSGMAAEEVECCWRVNDHRCGRVLPEASIRAHLATDHDACGADTRRLICMWINLTNDGSPSVCGSSFRRDNLNRHMAIHLGASKHECYICKRIYSRADTLRCHYRKVH